MGATENLFYFIMKFLQKNRPRCAGNGLLKKEVLALVHARPHAFAVVLALVHVFALACWTFSLFMDLAFAIVLALARWRARSKARFT